MLDKVVPGYYHRYDEDGSLCGSCCGANTASEHAMLERMIVDDVLHWALNYKASPAPFMSICGLRDCACYQSDHNVCCMPGAQVDSFRFDIMGHLMMRTMNKVREALAALTLEQHGVDGSKIYLYGEGWEFAEVGTQRANFRFGHFHP